MKKEVRKFSRWIAGALVVLYLLMFYFLNFQRDEDYKNCPLYTEAMKGGYKIFMGEEYRVELCGLVGFIQPENFPYDQVRLRIYSAQGELLAKRYFEPVLGMPHIMELEYGPSYLTYDEEGKSNRTLIAMPPSRKEWIKARMPRFWP